MNGQRLQVVKVGGSLLHGDALRGRLQRWLRRQTPAHHLLMAGGGGFADLIRQADKRHGFDEKASHWLCISAMRTTARLLAEVLPEATLTVRYGRLREAIRHGRLTLFDPWSFLRAVEPRLPGTRLPETWDVTSDAIAARLAIVLGADELVLLKSVLPAPAADIGQLAASGYVDRFFPQLVGELPTTRAVDLSTEGFPNVVLPR